jgi:hypothetical protein
MMRRRLRAVTVPTPLACGALLAAVRLSVKLLGLGRSIRLVRRWVDDIPHRHDLGPDTVRQAARAVALAGAFFPGRAICLEQSLTLYVLLRRRGIAAVLCIGVQPYPFFAHAWVEFQGVPVNEEEEVVRQFVPFPEIVG